MSGYATAPERLAIQPDGDAGGLFSAETALVHHLGSAISIVHFGGHCQLNGVEVSFPAPLG
jgi:hypothetical protein